MLTERDKKIALLEKEAQERKTELAQAKAKAQAAENQLNGVEARQTEKMYQLRLQLEEKARKQMESYARELSITYSTSDSDEAAKRIKSSAEGVIKENKELKEQVDKLEKQVEGLLGSVKSSPVFIDMQSRFG